MYYPVKLFIHSVSLFVIELFASLFDEFVDVGLVFGKTLVIADLHIGYEEALNKQGVLVPRRQFELTVERLKKLLEKTKPTRIIVLGDLKHEFGTISRQEWRESLRVLDMLLEFQMVWMHYASFYGLILN